MLACFCTIKLVTVLDKTDTNARMSCTPTPDFDTCEHCKAKPVLNLKVIGMAKRKIAESEDQGDATTNRRSSRRKTSDRENQAGDEGNAKPSHTIEGRALPKAPKTMTAKTKGTKKDATAPPKVPNFCIIQAFHIECRQISHLFPNLRSRAPALASHSRPYSSNPKRLSNVQIFRIVR